VTTPRLVRAGLLIAIAMGWCLPAPSAARLALGVPDAGERPVLSATVVPGALLVRPADVDRWTPAIRTCTALDPGPPSPLHLRTHEHPELPRQVRPHTCLPVAARPPPRGVMSFFG
jgi:hypothetical protein